MESGEFEIQRWNKEWLRYLGRQWRTQLRPHDDYPVLDALPESAAEMVELEIGGQRLHLYCHRDNLLGKRVLELGCGCGNLGKLIGPYVASYVGLDYSTLALAVARLVSPDNCTYIQVADRERLEPIFGAVDTVVSRWFWIHQNFKLGRANLEYLSRFLRPGGVLYADFRWPDLDQEQFVVFSPDEPLSPEYPSATFAYSEDDVRRLIDGLPFDLVSQEVIRAHQARYVKLQRSTD